MDAGRAPYPIQSVTAVLSISYLYTQCMVHLQLMRFHLDHLKCGFDKNALGDIGKSFILFQIK